jgi:hypothetical protein
MLECPRDPAPDLGAAIASFETLVRDVNNITWRNFDVVSFWGQWTGYDFFISGAQAQARRFDLEVMQTPPGAMHATLDVPSELADLIAPNNHIEITVDEARKRAMIVLPGEAAVRLDDILLPANSRYAVRFHVTAPKNALIDGHTLAIRQLSGELEVGRMTWRFAPPPGRDVDEQDPVNGRAADGR